MINSKDILETIKMIDEEYLDVRTITMGISLLDCADADIEKSCEKIYRKITTLAKDLVKVGNDIGKEYGIPIINEFQLHRFPCWSVSAAEIRSAMR